MNQYDASIMRSCLEFAGLQYWYEENLPEEFAVPSLYFPAAEDFPSRSALGSYQSEYSIYAKLFATSDREAVELAESIVQCIMCRNCRLPVYTAGGKESGEIVKLEPPTARLSDTNVAQITLTYKVIRSYERKPQPLSQGVNINKNYD